MAETGIVCVFAKPPRPGKVKTRLAAEIGPEAAADLARAFFADTWQTASALPWARPVLATTETGATEWSGIRAEAWPQGEGDLGDRMERVLRRALATAPFALAIGSDSPGLPQALLEKAPRRLESADAVIGPSADGGFYLLGLTRCPPGLLASLPWSAGDTCERTAERLRGRGLSVELLPPWFDVDRIGDLTRLRSLLARGEIVAPRTAAALRRAPPRISVVIPVLDEEARIARQLQRLAFLRGLCEVIVVDGGSRDRTVERARASGHARVITAPRGRADQMNAGAAAATGEVLLFLHADVELPADAPRIVAKALEAPEVVAGAFRTWTVPDGDCRRRLGPSCTSRTFARATRASPTETRRSSSAPRPSEPWAGSPCSR